MKAPEHTYQPPASGAQPTNFSMLPPDKLPNWLLEKNMPVRGYNYSMSAPGMQPQVIQTVPLIAVRGVPVQPPPTPPAAVKPTAMDKPPVPDQASDTRDQVSTATESNFQEGKEVFLTSVPTPEMSVPGIVDSMPAPNENVSVENNYQPAGREEEPRPFESSPPGDNHANTNANKPETEMYVPEYKNEPVIHRQTPVTPVVPPAYTSQTTPPDSPSFANWIFSNSQTSMMIVVGIIAFAIILIILLVLGVF